MANNNNNLIDPLRSRILNELRVHYHTLDNDFLLMTAKNLAFLIRHHTGADIDPSKVSLPMVDIYEAGGMIAHGAALIVHEGKGKSRVLLRHSSPAGHSKCLVVELSKMAEKAIVGVLEKMSRPVFDVELDESC